MTEPRKIPRTAPDVGVEIFSPGERRDVRREKIRVYLAAGSELVIFVDSEREVIATFDRAGERRLSGADVIEHAALPGLRFSVADPGFVDRSDDFAHERCR